MASVDAQLKKQGRSQFADGSTIRIDTHPGETPSMALDMYTLNKMAGTTTSLAMECTEPPAKIHT